jgi:hypothetical protein
VAVVTHLANRPDGCHGLFLVACLKHFPQPLHRLHRVVLLPLGNHPGSCGIHGLELLKLGIDLLNVILGQVHCDAAQGAP